MLDQEVYGFGTTVTGSNRNELGKDPTTLGFAHLNVMQPTHTTYTAG